MEYFSGACKVDIILPCLSSLKSRCKCVFILKNKIVGTDVKNSLCIYSCLYHTTVKHVGSEHEV